MDNFDICVPLFLFCLLQCLMWFSLPFGLIYLFFFDNAVLDARVKFILFWCSPYFTVSSLFYLFLQYIYILVFIFMFIYFTFPNCARILALLAMTWRFFSVLSHFFTVPSSWFIPKRKDVLFIFCFLFF